MLLQEYHSYFVHPVPRRIMHSNLLLNILGFNLMSNLSYSIMLLRCADGSLPSGLDLLHKPFPNLGNEVLPKSDFNCWQAKLFEAPAALQPYLTQYDNSNHYTTMTHLYDCMSCLFISSVIYTFSCFILHLVLNRFYIKFSLIRPVHKKWYVIVNVMKGIVLGTMILNTQFIPGILRMVFGGEFPILEAKRTTALYVMTDIVGLVLIPKLPFSTFMHHVMTLFIGMGIWSTNIGAQGWEGSLGVVKMSFLYGSFSCIPFSVNIFLGLRVMFHRKSWMIILCYFALFTYIISIGINWSLHIYWLYNCIKLMDISLSVFLYAGILVHIIRDDVILVKYIWTYPSVGKQD
ncbi:hypothetical protein LOD99_4837 [Oopsacas minuta]|uniref:Uncharacterized protein n=1 Tax=Oopsacas minuta TaxID=111878 RepID=A0AAV7JSB1_9METZ|nr:hypothetical protein LOD99_4837 [Oopsacas minuta]